MSRPAGTCARDFDLGSVAGHGRRGCSRADARLREHRRRRGVARALAHGAQGVSLGTRFVASEEANVHPEFKRRIVESAAEDTVYTTDLYDVGWPDAPHCTLRNGTFAEWDAAGRPPPGRRPGEGTFVGTRRSNTGELVDWPHYAVGMVTPEFEGDLDLPPMWAGEPCGVVNDVPAREIVHGLVAEAAESAS